jgi:hypothetical protein
VRDRIRERTRRELFSPGGVRPEDLERKVEAKSMLVE